MAVVVFPLLEEVVFRWGLLDWLDRRRRAWPPLANNAAVSLLFGLAHGAAWGVAHAAAVVLPSLLLGLVWQRWRSLWRCVLLHAGLNAVGRLWVAGS
jgi:hypothetical protein